MILARVCLAGVALVAAAWFALGAHQARDTNAAAAILSKAPQIAGPQAPRVDRLLRSVKALNPDLTVKVLQGKAAFLEHQEQRSLRTLKDAVRREPMNLQAWVYLAEASLSADLKTVTLATRKIRQLDPKAG